MRRTFNNLMRRAQVDTVVLHATIGHSSDRMTEHYSHVDVEEKLAAVSRLVAAVIPERNSPNASPDCRDEAPTPSDPRP